jgi:hypothetical protein
VQTRVHISYTDETIMVKLSVIQEQNIIYKVWLSFQLFTGLYMAYISWQKLYFLDVVGVKTITMQNPPYL